MGARVKCKNCGHTTEIKRPRIFSPGDWEFDFDLATQSLILNEGCGVQLSVDCKGCGIRVLNGFVGISIPSPVVIWREGA